LPKLDIPRYAWGVFASYELYLRRLDTMELIRLTDNDGYDAEATICWKTGRIVFTSYRNGDLDLYSMRLDGSDLKRLTTTLGYEGGAFYSPDGKRIVFRAYLPKTPDEIAEYKRLLQLGVVSPPRMELFVMDADGRNVRQITHLGGINFCPAWLPDGKRIIFASNHHDPKNFDLFVINADGTGLERVTCHPLKLVDCPDGSPSLGACGNDDGGGASASVVCQREGSGGWDKFQASFAPSPPSL